MKVGRLVGEATNDANDEYGKPNLDWYDVCAEMTTIMKDKTVWDAKVENFGWRNLSGKKYHFHAESGEELLFAIFPDTSCSFKVYRYGRFGFAIDNAHHDSPMGGEWYYITPAK